MVEILIPITNAKKVKVVYERNGYISRGKTVYERERIKFEKRISN